MLFIYANNTEITEHVWRNSIRITEQLNNRANTLSLTVDQYSIAEGSRIEVFSWFKLTQQSNSWTAVLHFDEPFEFFEKFRSGDVIIVWIKESTKQKKIIDSIDHSAKTITLTSNLDDTFPQWTKCWRIEFSGVTLKNPDEEIWSTWTFSFKANCTDRTKIFDAENVVETFQEQYSREIFWRIIYEYNATDTSENLDLFESAWTNSWTARVMLADTSDRIQWTNSMKTGVTGSWTALWTKTITSLDLNWKEHFRIWTKISDWYGQNVLAMKYRVWTDASNYYEWTSRFIWSDNQDCWNFEAFRFDESSVVWTPDIADISRIQIEIETDASIPSWWIHFDHSFASSWWFTLNNTIRGDKKFEDVRVQYKKPTVVVEDICKLQNFFWFIDYERDLHFFKQNGNPAPFELTDDSMNFGDLSITTDISQLKNRQTVRGGEAIDATLYEQRKVADGVENSFRLDYKPKTLSVFVDSGSWFVQKTVWIENLDDPTAFEFLFNFNEKIVKNSTHATLNSGDEIKLTYYPYKPIRVRVKNDDSIETMKNLLWWNWIYDGAVINDASIRDWNEARLRAKAEIDAYSNPIITASFITEKEWLQAWQVVKITDTARWIIEKEFLIQKVNKTSKSLDKRTYSVEAWSTMFWIIEFFQLLLKRSEKLLIDVSEIVDVVQNIDKTITIQPLFTFTKKENEVTAWTLQARTIDATFSAWFITTESRFLQWYVKNLGSGQFSFDNFTNWLEKVISFSDKKWTEKILWTIPSVVWTTMVEDRFWTMNRARRFDWSNDYFSYTVPSYTNPDEVTFFFRNKPTWTSDRAVIDFAGHLIQSNWSELKCWTNTASEAHTLSRLNGGVRESVAITISFLTNEKKWFIDGRLVQTDTIAVAKQGGSFTAFTIGQYAAARFFQWDISDVQIYQRILSDKEIANICNWYQTEWKAFNISVYDSTGWCSFWTTASLKPSTQYTVDVWLQIPSQLQNVLTNGGAMCKIGEYSGFTLNGDLVAWSLATHIVFDEIIEQQDFTKHSITFTTNSSTSHWLFAFYLYNAEWMIRIGEVQVKEVWTETETNPWIASFSQAL